MIDDFIEVAQMEPQRRQGVSPVSDKASEQQSQNIADPIELPASASNGQRSRLDRSNKASSVVSTVSTENPSIPQISVTDSSSTTDATPSMVNGRATASESLSSLSEIDTVDSEAETERIEEFEEEPEEVETAQVAIGEEDGDNEVADDMAITPAIGTSEDEGRPSDQVRQHSPARQSQTQSPGRGRKRRRRENGNGEDTPSDEQPEQPLEDTDESPLKRSRLGSNDEDDVKPADAEDIDAPAEEAEEAEPDEGIPSHKPI